MRSIKRCVSAVLCLLVVLPLNAQQSSASGPQPVMLLQNALAALAGSSTIADITLTGTVRSIAGSDDESGPATLKAVSAGASRVDLNLSSGNHSEVQNCSSTPSSGSWAGPDGVPHATAFHNLLAEPAWFSPALAIQHRLSSSTFVATYVANETLDGRAVEHISVSQPSPTSASLDGELLQHLSQVDFYLDSATLLPAAISFNVHPDNDALFDIPVQVRFSDYRLVNGAQIPFRIQKFLNHSLLLDFQVQTVALNSGLSASQVGAQ